MKKLATLLAAALLPGALLAGGGTLNDKLITQRTTFEKPEDIQHFKGAQLTLSPRHFKEGQHSLQ